MSVAQRQLQYPPVPVPLRVATRKPAGLPLKTAILSRITPKAWPHQHGTTARLCVQRNIL